MSLKEWLQKEIATKTQNLHLYSSYALERQLGIIEGYKRVLLELTNNKEDK